MKDPFTGEVSGPPLEHSEWLEEQQRMQDEERAQKEAEKSRRASAKRAAAPAGGVDEEEPTFHGHPLSHFDGMTDEQVLGVKGVGEATLADIRKAQKKAAKSK